MKCLSSYTAAVIVLVLIQSRGKPRSGIVQKVEKTEGNEKSPRKRRVVFNKVKQADYTQAAIAGSALPDTASRRSWMGAVIAAPIPSYVIYLRAHYIVCDRSLAYIHSTYETLL